MQARIASSSSYTAQRPSPTINVQGMPTGRLPERDILLMLHLAKYCIHGRTTSLPVAEWLHGADCMGNSYSNKSYCIEAGIASSDVR